MQLIFIMVGIMLLYITLPILMPPMLIKRKAPKYYFWMNPFLLCFIPLFFWLDCGAIFSMVIGAIMSLSTYIKGRRDSVICPTCKIWNQSTSLGVLCSEEYEEEVPVRRSVYNNLHEEIGYIEDTKIVSGVQRLVEYKCDICGCIHRQWRR